MEIKDGFTEIGVIPPVPCVMSGSRPCHIQCSPDGKRLIYGTTTGIVSRCLPDQVDMKSKTVEIFTGNRTTIKVAAISPDQNVYAGGDTFGTIYIWRKSKDGTQLAIYKPGMLFVRITDLSFSDDSTRLAICGVDKYSKKLGTCIFVDGGYALGNIDGHTLGINSITFRQKKPYAIATGGVDGLVCIYLGPPFKLVHTTEGHNGQVFCVRYSPDGEHLVSCGEDGKLVIWDLRSGGVDHYIHLSSGRLLSLAWSMDSSRVVVVGVDRRIRLIDISTGTILDDISCRLDEVDSPTGVCWTSTSWVCVICENGRILGCKMDAQNNFLVEQQFMWQGIIAAPTVIHANQMSGRAAIGDKLGTVLFLWTHESDLRAFNVINLPTPITIKSTLIGKELGAVISNDGIIRLFKLPKDRMLQSNFIKNLETTLKKRGDNTSMISVHDSHSTYVRSMSRFADGQTTVDSTGNGTLGVTKEVGWLGTHQFKDCPIKAISIDNEKVILIACANGTVHAYPFQSAALKGNFDPLWSMKLHGTITSISTSIDGTLVAIALTANEHYPLEKFGDDRTSFPASPYLIEMYEIDDSLSSIGFRFVCVYELHNAEITYLALNPGGTYLASADVNHNIFAVEVETGKKLITNEWTYHTTRITNLDWSPDGTKLASGSLDRDVYIWDIESPSRKIHIRDAHQGGVTCVQFIFNNIILTAGSDGVLNVYELTFGSPPSDLSPHSATPIRQQDTSAIEDEVTSSGVPRTDDQVLIDVQ